MMNRINAIGNQPQMTFNAKPGNRKQIHEFIDKTSDLAMDFLNKDRPIEEKREIAMRKSLAALKIKCTYIGEIVKKGKATIEHVLDAYKNKTQKTNKQFIEKAVKDGVMDADHAGSLLTKTKH